MTQEIDPRDARMRAPAAIPRQQPATPPRLDHGDLPLVQAPQRGTLVAISVTAIVLGAVGFFLGLLPALFGGDGLIISGAVLFTGGLLLYGAVAALSWWQVESRQQLGLLARGLDELAGGDNR